MTNPTDEFNKAVESALRAQFEVEDDPSCAREHFDHDIGLALASIQASTQKLLLELIGPDEQTVPGGMYGVDYKNAFRQELRAKIHRMVDHGIKDLTNE